jgi:hypothetical protein
MGNRVFVLIMKIMCFVLPRTKRDQYDKKKNRDPPEVGKQAWFPHIAQTRSLSFFAILADLDRVD